MLLGKIIRAALPNSTIEINRGKKQAIDQNIGKSTAIKNSDPLRKGGAKPKFL